MNFRWQLNGPGDEYIRVSTRSGYEIPIPSQAKVTYEYLQPENYIGMFLKVFKMFNSFQF